MTTKQSQAINLLIEDLYTSHPEIRNQAKLMNCESELNQIRDDVIRYLKDCEIIQSITAVG